jgi:hypothetical protein
VTDPSTKQLQRNFAGIAGHVPPEQPVIFAGIRTLFPWAPFRSTKAAIKLHTLLDLRGQIPSFIHISDGKLHDVNVLDILIPEAGAVSMATFLDGDSVVLAVKFRDGLSRIPIGDLD